MPQSKIKSVSAHPQTGPQRSWTNKFTSKLNYAYVIEFDNGDSGECSSESPGNYPMPVGTLVSYELSDTSHGNKISKIKKVDPPPANGNGNGKSTYNDPEIVKKISMGMCQQATIDMLRNIGGKPASVSDINKIADKLNQWVIADIPENSPQYRDLISRKYYSIAQAVACLTFPSLFSREGKKMSDILTDVVAMAEELMKPFARRDENGG